MPDFQQTRSKLRQGNRESGDLQLEIFAASERLRYLEKERDALERQKGDNNAQYQERLRKLDAQVAEQERIRDGKKNDLETLRRGMTGIESDFTRFLKDSEPDSLLNEYFPASAPFLLFPLRLETRFKTVDGKQQLWVRVYPDECLVDSFDPLLSMKEVNNAGRFWAEYHGAGKSADPANPDKSVVDLQKAAWKLLVNAHGDGRAAWITRRVVPDGSSIFPVRGDKSWILSIVTESWNPAHHGVITGLFKALWLADGNDKETKQIKAAFNTANPGLDADEIIDQYKPVNFDDNLTGGLKRNEAQLQFAIVIIKDLDKIASKIHGWSRPSRVNLMPERLALLRVKQNKILKPIFGNSIPTPLATSPDPADPKNQLKPVGKDLEFAESIRWLADFKHAVEIGMGFVIDLEPDELEGFDRLMVLGVRLDTDADEGKKLLEELFDHHFHSSKGFSILPQGTPTNNTGSADSGYSTRTQSDKTFDLYVNDVKGFKKEDQWHLKRDGQWLADWLGLEYEPFMKVLNSDGKDQADARNMNKALWPATLGYVLESLMEDGFTPEALGQVRSFFADYISGRGPVPAILIGRQPYGILPTAPFKRLGYLNQYTFVKNLYELLKKIEDDWVNNHNMLSGIAQVAEPSATAYQKLLDILSLHPNSVEFHRRYLESLIEISNGMILRNPGYYYRGIQVIEDAKKLLQDTLGYPSPALPQIAALLGVPWQSEIKHLVDDSPLSETKYIREYTEDKRNYIRALIDQAIESEDALRTGKGFKERPEAELYRLLKYALELGYYDSVVKTAEAANIFTAAKIASMKIEQPFAHQAWKQELTESRYALMYRKVPELSQSKTVAELVRDSLFAEVIPEPSQYLKEQLEALAHLEDATTARLERAFVEHLDCCSYRLDAWKTGILTHQLSVMRNVHPQQWGRQERQTGIYLGAFGWLENVRPERMKKIAEKTIPEDLVAEFNPGNDKVFLTDHANEGYIHAPSLNQAVTAAVMRNGYISHGKQDGNSVMSVNLTSERIRLALTVIEGIQGGQSLAALLGYQFERRLHDRKDLTDQKIDSYIYPLRKRFPLNANKINETKVEGGTDPDNVPITALEARNVIHGVDLINHVKSQIATANKSYPFGLTLPSADPVIATAITTAVQDIIEIADAVADLGMSESVHQVVMGNYDRAAGVLETFSKGNYPQEPDVIRTPRSGVTLSHRVGIPLEYVASGAGSPRTIAEPSLNKWLQNILPPMNKIICECTYIRRADDTPKNVPISMQHLGLAPIDLLYILQVADTRSLNELDDRMLQFLFSNSSHDPRIDANINFSYMEEPAGVGEISVFQILPLLRSLRAAVLESVPLSPGDMAIPGEVVQKDLPAGELHRQRVDVLYTRVKDVFENAANTGILNYLAGLKEEKDATETELETMRQQADTTIAGFSSFLLELGTYGIPQTGIGSLYTQRQLWFVSLKRKVQEFISRWEQQLTEYATLDTSATPDLETLQKLERLVSAIPTPADTISYTIVKNKKNAFGIALNGLKKIITDNQPGIAQLIAEIKAKDLSPFDLTALDISKELGQITSFIYDLKVRAKSLTDDWVGKRLPALFAMLGEIENKSPADKAKHIETIARHILGDEFKMFPRYALPPSQQAELANAWQKKDQLLAFLTKPDANPAEDWLHGIARVHDKMKHLENCLLLREAFGLVEENLVIHPVQLPFKTLNYHWMAMPFPPDLDLEEGNILLYTAFTDKNATVPTEVCGVLVDEWTELIPAKKETTGITFHYDRPNNEAPQTMLLVLPAEINGNWQWDDLVESMMEALHNARLRAIEPAKIDEKPYARFLPAVVAAESMVPYSIVLDNKNHHTLNPE